MPRRRKQDILNETTLFSNIRILKRQVFSVNKKDKKDEIILRQLELIRTMSEHNLNRMGSDFWGDSSSLSPDSPFREYLDKAPQTVDPPKAGGTPPAPAAASTGNSDAQTKQTEETMPPEKIEDLLAELDGYIGLTAIKKEVRSLINMVTVHKLRRENGLPTPDLSLHMVFSGNPGTGKTTVARIMARIYHSLGILSKGHLVEVDRGGLVAGYVGQTAIKTSKVIDSALGGVLFIDEAYALNNGAENDFGQEAINTILKSMEDHRDDLVVIVAGYDGLMDSFIHSNPGLESRFNRFLHFDDYTLDEMMQIFEMRCEKGCYELTEDARPLLREFIQLANTNSISFGNGRGVRNLFEQILVVQANRLAAQSDLSREDLMRITAADIRVAQGKSPEENEIEKAARESI